MGPSTWEEPAASSYTPAYESTMSPVADQFAEGAAAGRSLKAVAYDGYLDQCQVSLTNVCNITSLPSPCLSGAQPSAASLKAISAKPKVSPTCRSSWAQSPEATAASTRWTTSWPPSTTVPGACPSAPWSTRLATLPTLCLLPGVSPAVLLSSACHVLLAAAPHPVSHFLQRLQLTTWRPAGGDYPQLTQADRTSAGFCYDMATLLPMYNPLATPVPTYIDPNSTSVAATALSTILVFGQPFGKPLCCELADLAAVDPCKCSAAACCMKSSDAVCSAPALGVHSG